MSTLAERLQEAMAETGVKQVDIARACGIKPPSVNGWLNGQTKNLRGANLVATARLLNVSEAWLADGIEPKARRTSIDWPFTAAREDFEKLHPEDRRTLDKTLTSFIAGTLASYGSEEKNRDSTAIQRNELSHRGATMSALDDAIEAMEAVAQGSGRGQAKRANSGRGKSG